MSGCRRCRSKIVRSQRRCSWAKLGGTQAGRQAVGARDLRLSKCHAETSAVRHELSSGLSNRIAVRKQGCACAETALQCCQLPRQCSDEQGCSHVHGSSFPQAHGSDAEQTSDLRCVSFLEAGAKHSTAADYAFNRCTPKSRAACT